MKPAPFEYLAPDSPDAALDVLARSGGGSSSPSLISTRRASTSIVLGWPEITRLARESGVRAAQQEELF
jgi:hypothetical protein